MEINQDKRRNLRMKSKKMTTVCLALALLLMALPLGGVWVESSAQEPVMGPFSKSGNAGRSIIFTKSDFLSQINGELNLEGIVISELPDASTGALQYGNRTLLVGEAVTAEGLDVLRFIPVQGVSGITQFSFWPIFRDGIGSDSIAVNLLLSAKENRPPIVENMALTTYKNMPLAKEFTASDPDGDLLTFVVTSKAKRGEVIVKEDGSFVYTPYQNKTGADKFTFKAVDPFGNESPEAEITVTIEKPSTKLTYADMEGHPSHYAAIRLHEENIFTGEKVGAVHFFNPERLVTRGEFLSMALGLMEITDFTPVNKTGFADDAVTPAWVKPYALAALKTGLIKGVTDAEGRIQLGANKFITRNEIAVIVNNALHLSDINVMAPVGTGFSTVPDWALQATLNMDAVAVMSPKSVGWTPEGVTRAEVAEILLNAKQVWTQTQPKTGLLGWIFG